MECKGKAQQELKPDRIPYVFSFHFKPPRVWQVLRIQSAPILKDFSSLPNPAKYFKKGNLLIFSKPLAQIGNLLFYHFFVKF